MSCLDYSQTCIYEIVCKNENVATKFIGYTTNFTQRKYHHKRNILSNNNNAMYNVISENGGFENWNIRKLHVYKCENVNDARALLNNYTGYIHENERSNNYRCEICDYVCITKGNLNNHYKTKKHLTNEMNKKQGAAASRPSALVREGFAPPAHINAQRSREENLWFPPPVQPQINELSKIVIDITKQSSKAQDELTQLVIDLTNENSKTQKQMKQMMKCNQELQNNVVELHNNVAELHNDVVELCKRPTTAITNNNNQTFNLMFFLNETCKNAMSIDDFIDNLDVSIEEALRQVKTPYIEGFASILKDRLCNKLKIHERPIHYTDAKREILYYKDRASNGWVKDDNHTVQVDLSQAVTKQIAIKFRKNPESFTPDARDYICGNMVPKDENDRLKIMRSIMPGLCIDKKCEK